MILRRLVELEGTGREVRPESGNWLSRRLLLEEDGLGFSLHDTLVHAGTETLIHYRHHVEAVYCIEGEGEVELLEGGKTHPVGPGTMYALDGHERHLLRAKTDMRIICVFTPPLVGGEVHREDGSYPPSGRETGTQGSPARGAEPADLKFVYLNLQGHPRGNLMLHRLMQAGFLPQAVIEERSPLAGKGRRALLEELEKIEGEVPLPPALSEIVGAKDIPRVEVANHNDEECAEALRGIRPDLVVLGDVRILRPRIFTIPPMGTVNVHPGFLPLVRGNTPYIWAIANDLPQGCTVHFIDEGIDTGPILLRRMIDPARSRSYPWLLAEINEVCGELLVEVMEFLRTGLARGIPQANFERHAGEARTYHLAPPQVKADAVRKFEA